MTIQTSKVPSLESLEARKFLSVNLPGLHPVEPDAPGLSGQVVYLDFAGASNVSYRGPVSVSNISVPKYKAPTDLHTSQAAIIASVVKTVKVMYNGTGVRFTTVAPGRTGTFSTIFIGGDGSDFSRYGSFIGLSEDVDAGNRNHADNAFVFSDNITANGNGTRDYARRLGTAIAHEAGHLLGFAHDTNEIRGALASVAAVYVGAVAGGMPLRLPFNTGQSFIVTNGYGTPGDGDHNGYGVDFGMSAGTPVVATYQGVVIDVNDYTARSSTGTYPNGSPMSSRDLGGVWVKIRHTGTTSNWDSSYLHFSSRIVNIGDSISTGQVIGYSGHSGWTVGVTGDHLHFHIRNTSGTGFRPVPMSGVDLSNPSSNTISDFVQGHTYRAIDLPASGPVNDNFANSTVISATAITVNGTNVGATKESGEPNHAGNTGGRSVWFSWTPSANGTVTIDTAGSGTNFDTTLGIYTGNSISSMYYVASDDDSGGNYTSRSSFSVYANQTYRIAVDGWNGAAGSFALHLNLSSPNVTPVAPSNLTWTRTQSGQIRMSWVDGWGRESAQALQYWTGSSWSTFGTVSAGASSVLVNGPAGQSFYLRILAYDSTNQLPSSTIFVTF